MTRRRFKPKSSLVFADGVADPMWDRGIAGFDEAISYNSCVGAGGAGCPNLGWELVVDEAEGRDQVLEITHGGSIRRFVLSNHHRAVIFQALLRAFWPSTSKWSKRAKIMVAL